MGEVDDWTTDDAFLARTFGAENAEWVAGYVDGRNTDTPKPSANRHPAYRHSWEVGRAEREGNPIPVAFSKKRAAEIEAGGDFYPYVKDTTP